MKMRQLSLRWLRKHASITFIIKTDAQLKPIPDARYLFKSNGYYSDQEVPTIMELGRIIVMFSKSSARRCLETIQSGQFQQILFL
jgi:hypothetical protein